MAIKILIDSASDISKDEAKRLGINLDMPYGVIYSGNDEAIALDYIQDSFARLNVSNDSDLHHYVIGSTIGTHLGPGVVGIAFFEK